MGIKKQETKKQGFQYYRRKRTMYLSLIIGIPLFILILYLILEFATQLEADILVAIFFPILFIYAIVLISLRARISVYNAYYNYLVMVRDKRDPYQAKKKIYTTTWLNHIKKLGYGLSYEDHTVQIYSGFIKRHRAPALIKDTVLVIAVAKGPSLNFYSEQMDDLVQSCYPAKGKNVRRVIVLQFKKFPGKITDELIEELDSIINLKRGQNYLIHINVGFFPDVNKIYFLEPKRKFPSKYYYYAIEKIKELTYLKRVDYPSERQEAKSK